MQTIDATTNEMRFCHFRQFETRATKIGLMGKKFAKNKSIESPLRMNPRGGVTLGYVIKDDKTLWVAAAVCGRRDLFNRKRALSIVRGRFTKGQYDVLKANTKEKAQVYKALETFVKG